MDAGNLRAAMNRATNRSWPGNSTLTALVLVLVRVWVPGLAAAAEQTVIHDKTLVAWVSPLADLTHAAAVAMIEKSGGVFDALVLGENTDWRSGWPGA